MSSSNNIPFILCTLLFVSFALILVPPCLSERCHPEEKKVLLKIKKAFNNPSVLNESWLPHTDCCNNYWYGIMCDDTTNHVTALIFLADDFPAPIPSAIADLPHLTAIIFFNLTRLSGPIPFSITKLQNLEHLEISWSNLNGTIPGFLSKIKKLNYLNLSHNNLTGSIPTSLSDVPSLNFIQLDRNRLTGTIPESLVKLKRNGGLSLILAHNKLSGKIPPSFRDINFDRIDFSNNKLSGDISMLFGRNKTTYYLNVARNKFESSMSRLKLNPKLTDLDIRHNNIYGSLPKEMINIKWESLNVSYNRLCGPIPQGGNLQTKFNYASFFHNRCLCGAPLTVACK